ncbi:polyprenyl synthetase family protein [Candidatus Microgenomates bacterium]|nr:polyprenyl synthetase family protein [Candidatus Microgenomates bacterium]
MDFKSYLEHSAQELDREIQSILGVWLKEVEGISPKLIPLAKAFIKACQGGKRIRGTLVRLGYEIGNQSSAVSLQSPDIIKVGAAYEIFHTAILIHDDIIDESLLRRGQPSLYKALGGGHYGISQAISLADLGFFLSFKIITEAEFDNQRKLEALKLFFDTIVNTALGQILDLEKTDPILIAKLKTAHYTIAGPLQLGAILGGAKEELVKLLGLYGVNLGIAFQIKDDILDGDGTFELEQAIHYKNQAIKLLPSITKDPKMSKLLKQMAEYLVERKK